MQKTKIHWCDSTVNPVAGCEGCELWASESQIVTGMSKELASLTGMPATKALVAVRDFARQNAGSTKKDLISKGITTLSRAGGSHVPEHVIEATIKKLKGRLLKCYAGILTENRGGKIKGYPGRFERPEMFPGRMLEAAKWKNLAGTSRPEKPWLNGLPRLIFISDMGDALCSSITFEYLHREIVEICETPKGRRHVWLWLTKRPARMAEFSEWLIKSGSEWPDNLVAMTTITSDKTLGRVAELRKVKCKLRGLSVEPLWSAVDLPLVGIGWVIVGGESGHGTEPFQLEWARDIHKQCRQAGGRFS